MTDKLAMFVRNTSDLENNVVAVERIQEYSEVEQEVSNYSIYTLNWIVSNRSCMNLTYGSMCYS